MTWLTRAAALLGTPDGLGRLAAGNRADRVLLDGDPPVRRLQEHGG